MSMYLGIINAFWIVGGWGAEGWGGWRVCVGLPYLTLDVLALPLQAEGALAGHGGGGGDDGLVPPPVLL